MAQLHHLGSVVTHFFFFLFVSWKLKNTRRSDNASAHAGKMSHVVGDVEGEGMRERRGEQGTIYGGKLVDVEAEDNVRDQGEEAEPCSLSRPTYLSVYPGVYVRRELE